MEDVLFHLFFVLVGFLFQGVPISRLRMYPAAIHGRLFPRLSYGFGSVVSVVFLGFLVFLVLVGGVLIGPSCRMMTYFSFAMSISHIDGRDNVKVGLSPPPHLFSSDVDYTSGSL